MLFKTNIDKYLLFINLSILFSYLLVVQNDFSIDDYLYHEQISHINNLYQISEVFNLKFGEADYRPITSLIFVFEKLIFGDIYPSISHFINLILYICCISILYKTLEIFFNNRFISIIATSLFAYIPLHNSMVSNIKNRDGLLSFLFGFIYIYLLLVILKTKNNYLKFAYLLTSISLIFLSIYSKLDGLGFLFITPFLLISIYKYINIKFFLRSAIILFIFYRISTTIFFKWGNIKKTVYEQSNVDTIEDHILYTENPIIAYDGIAERSGFVIQTIFEYLKMAFKPFHHYFYYGFDMVSVLPIYHYQIILKIISILTFLSIGLYFFFKKQPYILYGYIFFFITSAFAFNIITPVSGIIADRYIFIGSAGLCLSLAGGIYLIYKNCENYFSIKNISKEKFIWISIIATFLIYTPFNVKRILEWKDLYTIIDADVSRIGHKSYEINRIAMQNYIEKGFDSENQNDRSKYLQLGRNFAEQAIKIYPDRHLAHEGYALASYGLNEFRTAKTKALSNIIKYDSMETSLNILYDIYTKESQTDSIIYILGIQNKQYPLNDFYTLKYVEFNFKAGHIEHATEFCDSMISKYPNQGGAYQAKSYIYLSLNDTIQAVQNATKAFELGIKDHFLLETAINYWAYKDQDKYNDLLKYTQ